MVPREIIDALRERVRSLRRTNLVYLRRPVVYNPQEPAIEIADALGVAPISVMEIVVEVFCERWDRVLQAEADGHVAVAELQVREAILAAVRSRDVAVLGDTDVLHAFPGIALTALLNPESEKRLIAVSLRASEPVSQSIRLLADGPTYPIQDCTLYELGS